MDEQCPATEVIYVVGGGRAFFRCGREANHKGEHFGVGSNRQELYWHDGWRDEPMKLSLRDFPDEQPGVGRGVLFWVALGLLFWVIVIAIGVVLTR